MGMRFCRLLVAAWMLLGVGLLQAQALRPVPPLSGRVIDQTATLTSTQRDALSTKLSLIERQYGAQLVVLIVDSVKPEDIAAYAQRVGETWKIGRRKVGDGLLIVVAKQDRKMRIEVAKSLEGAVPDLLASRIIADQMAPAFKAGDYAGGLNAAVDRLTLRILKEDLPRTARINAPDKSTKAEVPGLQDLPPLTEIGEHGPYTPAPKPAEDTGPGLGIWALLLFFAVPVAGALFSSLLGRKLGALGTGGIVGAVGFWLTSNVVLAGVAAVAALLLVGLFGLGSRRRGLSDLLSGLGSVLASSSSSSGSWSSGSSGGGFSSGGGGDFGGGGASGDW